MYHRARLSRGTSTQKHQERICRGILMNEHFQGRYPLPILTSGPARDPFWDAPCPHASLTPSRPLEANRQKRLHGFLRLPPERLERSGRAVYPSRRLF